MITKFKREYTDDIKYAVIAFANTDGGKIYIGMKDDGIACGVSDVDDIMLRVTNMVRDMVRPILSEWKRRQTGRCLRSARRIVRSCFPDNAYAYMNQYNRTRAEFEGLDRIDIRDYPEEALREALLNAIVHRLWKNRQW